MKKILLLFISLVSVVVNAQNKTIKVSTIRLKEVTGEYCKDVNLETKDTLSYVTIGFQNAKYSNISDYKTLHFNNQTQLDEFINDLKTALPELGTKQILTWNRKLYDLTIGEGFSNTLFLFADTQSGYTMLKKNDIEKLLKWFESFRIGKE